MATPRSKNHKPPRTPRTGAVKDDNPIGSVIPLIADSELVTPMTGSTVRAPKVSWTNVGSPPQALPYVQQEGDEEIANRNRQLRIQQDVGRNILKELIGQTFDPPMSKDELDRSSTIYADASANDLKRILSERTTTPLRAFRMALTSVYETVLGNEPPSDMKAMTMARNIQNAWTTSRDLVGALRERALRLEGPQDASIPNFDEPPRWGDEVPPDAHVVPTISDVDPGTAAGVLISLLEKMSIDPRGLEGSTWVQAGMPLMTQIEVLEEVFCHVTGEIKGAKGLFPRTMGNSIINRFSSLQAVVRQYSDAVRRLYYIMKGPKEVTEPLLIIPALLERAEAIQNERRDYQPPQMPLVPQPPMPLVPQPLVTTPEPLVFTLKEAAPSPLAGAGVTPLLVQDAVCARLGENRRPNAIDELLKLLLRLVK